MYTQRHDANNDNAPSLSFVLPHPSSSSTRDNCDDANNDNPAHPRPHPPPHATIATTMPTLRCQRQCLHTLMSSPSSTHETTTTPSHTLVLTLLHTQRPQPQHPPLHSRPCLARVQKQSYNTHHCARCAFASVALTSALPPCSCPCAYPLRTTTMTTTLHHRHRHSHLCALNNTTTQRR